MKQLQVQIQEDSKAPSEKERMDNKVKTSLRERSINADNTCYIGVSDE